MPRNPRRIISGRVYDICFRTQKGLPFAPRPLINEIVVSCLARANRDQKVILNHFIVMGNHIHLLCTALDQQMMANYMAEVQKKITDCLKKIFGLRKLRLWEGRPHCAELIAIDDVINRIQYFYLNPTNANLVNSIEEYPGVSSWHHWKSSKDDLNEKKEQTIRWYKSSTLNFVSFHKSSFSKLREDLILHNLRKKATTNETLILQPNYWMKSFGIDSSERVEEVNQEIRRLIEKRKKDLTGESLPKKSFTVGRKKLLKQLPTLSGWQPRKKSRRIFLICADKKLRLYKILEYRKFFHKCRKCYNEWLSGCVNTKWPPGAFIPPLPRLQNWISL